MKKIIGTALAIALLISSTPSAAAQARLEVTTTTNQLGAVPLGASNVEYARLEISNNSIHDIQIQQIVWRRIGVGSPTDFIALRMTRDGYRLSSSKEINRDNRLYFNLSREEVVIPARRSITLRLLGDLTTDPSASGHLNSFVIDNSADFIALDIETGKRVQPHLSSEESLGTKNIDLGIYSQAEISSIQKKNVSYLTPTTIGEFTIQNTGYDDLDLRYLNIRASGGLQKAITKVGVRTKDSSRILAYGQIDLRNDYLTFELRTPVTIPRGSGERFVIRAIIDPSIAGVDIDRGDTLYLRFEERGDITLVSQDTSVGASIKFK